jgi:acetyl-CoA acetyltransferase
VTSRADGVCFIGLGSTPIERKSDRGLLAFAQDAALAAIAEAGLCRDDIDGYVGAPLATGAGSVHADGGDEITARTLVESLGMRRLAYANDNYKGFPTDMVIAASHALLAGACRYVLGVRALYNLPEIDYATAAPTHAFGVDQFKSPFGATAAGARFATRATAYFDRTGASRRDLYEVVALARRHATLNPIAVWRERQLSLEEYLAAPMIASPLGRYDCDMPVCGATAFVMACGEDRPAASAAPVYLAGSASWLRTSDIFSNARRTRADIDHAQIYDGFSCMVWEWLERLGFCPPDSGWKFIRDGHANRDGLLPLNTFGGSLGEGRLHGIGHLREAILQVSGRAGPRQLAKAENALVQVGTFDFSSLLILSASP